MERRQAEFPGRQQSFKRHGKLGGHHRGLRPGHVLKGVARELGSPKCFLDKYGREDTVRKAKLPALKG